METLKFTNASKTELKTGYVYELTSETGKVYNVQFVNRIKNEWVYAIDWNRTESKFKFVNPKMMFASKQQILDFLKEN